MAARPIRPRQHALNTYRRAVLPYARKHNMEDWLWRTNPHDIYRFHRRLWRKCNPHRPRGDLEDWRVVNNAIAAIDEDVPGNNVMSRIRIRLFVRCWKRRARTSTRMRMLAAARWLPDEVRLPEVFARIAPFL